MTSSEDPDARAERDLVDLERRTEALEREITDAREDLVEQPSSVVTGDHDAGSADTEVDDGIAGAVGDRPEEADEPESEGAPKGWG